MGVLGGLTVILDPPRRLGQREVQTDGHPLIEEAGTTAFRQC